MNVRMPMALVLAAGLAAAGCSPKTRDLACSTDEECQEGEACIDHQCTPVECLDDADCAGDEICVQHTCREAVDCQDDTDCAADEICDGGTCRLVECKQDGDCPSGEVCREHQCVEQTGCTSDEDCAADEICDDGACVRVECKQDEDCPDDERCIGHTCVAGPECELDGDCPAGSICEQGVCVEGCRSSRDCPEGLVCLPDEGEHGLCVACGTDEDCAQGEACIDHVCVQYCESDADCTEGHCDPVTHACVECVGDGHCAAGTICVENACVEGCRQDRDCPEGQICEDDVCRDGCRQDSDCPSGSCDPATHTCIDCVQDDDCAPGNLCIDGHCTPGCGTDRDCPEGQVCSPDLGEHGTCVACLTDADCIDPELPRCVDYECVPECIEDADCAGQDEVCIDNHCQPRPQECDLHIEPGPPVSFGSVRVGYTQAIGVHLANVGAAACTISELEVRESVMFPDDFAIANAPLLPLVLAPGGQNGAETMIEVVFAPAEDGEHRATLRLTSDDPDLQIGTNDTMCMLEPPQPGEACIRLEGTGALIELEPVPAALDFGEVTVGCQSREESLRFYNLGDEVVVEDIALLDGQNAAFEIRAAPSPPLTLAENATFDVRLRFTPQAQVAYQDTLALTLADAGVLEVPLAGAGTGQLGTTDTFPMPAEVKADVLWVVDNSGSMGEEQEALAENFSAFIELALSLGVDFHVGVIATEVNDPESDMGDPPRDVLPGVLVHAPDRPRFITPATQDPLAAFADNVRLGTCCSDEQEAGLESAWMALTPPELTDPALNGGFLRQDARLAVITVSDEEDQSSGPVDFYVDFLLSLKQTPAWISHSTICGDVPDGCFGDLGDAQAGDRYVEVMNRTGGVFQSICQADWSGLMAALGEHVFGPVRNFPLSRPADASTIVVHIDSGLVPEAGCHDCADGWTYHPDDNAVFLGDDHLAPAGSVVQVDYDAVCF